MPRIALGGQTTNYTMCGKGLLCNSKFPIPKGEEWDQYVAEVTFANVDAGSEASCHMLTELALQEAQTDV